jgi:hypothetical protein
MKKINGMTIIIGVILFSIISVHLFIFSTAK